MSREQSVNDLLLSIEQEMRENGLWGEQSPPEQALASQQPFCVDTLRFEEWVQWLMIPRLHVMIEQGLPLPQNSNMHTMAEEAMKSVYAETDQLVALIKQLDEALNIRH